MILFHFIFSCSCDNVRYAIDTQCKRNVGSAKHRRKQFILLNLVLKISTLNIELNYLNEIQEQTYSQSSAIIMFLIDVISIYFHFLRHPFVLPFLFTFSSKSRIRFSIGFSSFSYDISTILADCSYYFGL